MLAGTVAAAAEEEDGEEAVEGSRTAAVGLRVDANGRRRFLCSAEAADDGEGVEVEGVEGSVAESREGGEVEDEVGVGEGR